MMQRQLGDACPHCKRTDVPFAVGKYWCTPCRTRDTTERRQRNPERRRAQRIAAYTTAKLADPIAFKRMQKDRNLRYARGVTLDEIEALIERQGGLCAICRGPLYGGSKPYSVDHDHSIEGKRESIRGALCNRCNLLLGHAKDDPKLLRNAAFYLERAAISLQFGGGAVDCAVRRVDSLMDVLKLWVTGSTGQTTQVEDAVIAAVERQDCLCVVFLVRRVGLSVKTRTYCGEEVGAAEGTLQIPDQALTHSMTVRVDGRRKAICGRCRTAVAASIS